MNPTGVGRRRLLAGAAATLAAGAGCVGVTGAGRRPDRVSMLAAGSLNEALEHGLRAAVDADLAVEAHGSARAARLVESGTRAPDVVSVADTALFHSVLEPSWYAEFATNALVIAYDPDSAGGRRLARAGSEWYRPLLDGAVRLGRTDPDLDPLGYRTLFALELATAHYGLDTDLRAAVPRREQVYPETQLIGGFETGAIDAAVTYRSMAAARGYEFVALPPAVDLSAPHLADRYAEATYELPGGTVVRGGPISYAATVLDRRPAVEEVFETHVTGSYLESFGFGVPDDYPRFTPDVPDWFAG
jgi:molybdate/tungstate transport system substrate-binding protein